jgi:hypothetical protein
MAYSDRLVDDVGVKGTVLASHGRKKNREVRRAVYHVGVPHGFAADGLPDYITESGI